MYMKYNSQEEIGLKAFVLKILYMKSVKTVKILMETHHDTIPLGKEIFRKAYFIINFFSNLVRIFLTIDQ